MLLEQWPPPRSEVGPLRFVFVSFSDRCIRRRRANGLQGVGRSALDRSSHLHQSRVAAAMRRR